MDDGVPHLLRRGWRLTEKGPQALVAEVGPPFLVQLDDDLEDEVTPLLVGVEDTGPVAEVAIGVCERLDGPGLGIPDPHGLDHVPGLLPVSAHVLDGEGSHTAGDGGKVFDSPPAGLHGPGHKTVPVFPGGDSQGHGSLSLGQDGDPPGGDVDDQSPKAPVTDEKVAPAPKDKDRNPLSLGRTPGLDDVLLGFGAQVIPGRAADAKGGQISQGDVLFDAGVVEQGEPPTRH